METNLLFDLPEIKQDKPTNTCRNCTHRYKHTYGKMFYCNVFRQKGTAYGDKKIKASDPACPMFVKIAK